MRNENVIEVKSFDFAVRAVNNSIGKDINELISLLVSITKSIKYGGKNE